MPLVCLCIAGLSTSVLICLQCSMYHFYWPSRVSRSVHSRLFGMFHSGSAEDTKSSILQSLAYPCGVCKVIFATCALGMGIDIKCLRIVIHFGSPATIEEYQQEIGRAGRDGTRSEAVLLWNSSFLRHVGQKMRAFIMSEEFCRRRLLMKYFKSDVLFRGFKHDYCNVCSRLCQCDPRVCRQNPSVVDDVSSAEVRVRKVTEAQKQELYDELLAVSVVISWKKDAFEA